MTEDTLRLGFTSDKFAPYGHPERGVPFIYDRQQRILVAPSMWLTYIALIRGRTRSSLTWRSYGYGLLEWLQTCVESGWDWRTASDGQLAAFRNKFQHTKSPITKRPYTRRYINAILRRVAMFYRWAVANHYVAHDPFTYYDAYIPRAHAGLLPNAKKQFKKNDLTLTESRRNPIRIPISKLARIKSRLCPAYKLVIDWAITTGMRISEILALKVVQVPHTISADNDLIDIFIDNTKGGKGRVVRPPIAVVDATLQYIRNERIMLARKNQTMRRSTRLFLNTRGKELAYGAFYKAYHKACNAEISGATFHDIRHTFAINMLCYLLENPYNSRGERIDALLALRDLLGHENLHTVQVYLQALKQNADQISEPLNYFIQAVA